MPKHDLTVGFFIEKDGRGRDRKKRRLLYSVLDWEHRSFVFWV